MDLLLIGMLIGILLSATFLRGGSSLSSLPMLARTSRQGAGNKGQQDNKRGTREVEVFPDMPHEERQ
jgi:hypothetical protein